MTITIKDLAAMANTSTATVSRVLSNKPGVTEDKRRRVLQLAERLGYTPNRIAQNLALQKSHVLGFIAADLTNPVYIDFFRHVQHRVEPQGYQILMADSQVDPEKEKHNIAVMREHRAEGLLIFPVNDWKRTSDIDHFLQLKLQKFPFVIVGRIDGFGFDYVTSEEVDTARRVTRHLIDLGHKRIGFLGYDDTNRCISERFMGFRDALEEAGLPLADESVVRYREGWQGDLKALLRGRSRPTAIVPTNDMLALLAWRTIAECGMRVPDDLSLATFGDEVWSRNLVPSLTTTNENIGRVAEIAMDLLLSRMDEPSRAPEQRLVPQEFLVRESAAAPPKS